MRRSTASRRRSGRFRSPGLLLLLGIAACAPVPSAPLPGPEPAPPEEAPAEEAPVPEEVVTPTPPPLPTLEPVVRVGIAVDTVQVTLGASGEYEVFDAVNYRVIHRLPGSQQVVVRADPSGLRVGSGGMETQAGGLITVRAISRDGLVTIGGRPYRGDVVVQATPSGRLTVINRVDMEAYLLGVVPLEIGRVGPELLEAAKAQAVAARTYAIAYLGRRDDLGFDVFATVEDQVYGGASGEHDPVSRAVRETAGEILIYDGRPIEAYYHSSCAGRTAAIEEVWPEPPQPYLVSIEDVDPVTGQAYDVTSSRFRWTVRWPADSLRRIFNRTLADSLPAGVTDVGEIRDIQTLELTPSGRIARMRITTANATFEVGRDRIRWIFLTPEGPILNSSRFQVTLVRDESGRVTEVVADGMGWGHGIGMCQVGAMGRARAGQGYQQILQAYYPSTQLVPLYR